MLDGCFRIARTWDGADVGDDERVALGVATEAERVALRVEAPFHRDPAPSRAPGACPGLWDFEVVELFLVGRDDRALEIEIGPHGHHLVLQLAGPRRVIREGLPLELSVERSGDRWTAQATFPTGWLPEGLERANAFAIHGQGRERRYLACHPLGGGAPDFHRFAEFPPLPPPRGAPG